MKIQETPQYKALYFDLKINELAKNYSQQNPKGGYRKIQQFLLGNNFSHEQYSGYHSLYKTTDIGIFKLVKKMYAELPWLQPCVNHFEVTNIGLNHDLAILFSKEPAQIIN